jgi:uncharacterized cupredoxin-like copper-binding protein
MKISRLSTPLAALALLVTAFVIAGCGSSSSTDNTTTNAKSGTGGATQSTGAAPASTIDTALNEWSIKPSSSVAKSGKVTFNATNDGKLPHEVVVLKTNQAAGSLKVSNGRVSEKDSVGEVSDVAAGKSKSGTLDLKPGNYVLVCNLPGHYQAGMYTSLTVK